MIINVEKSIRVIFFIKLKYAVYIFKKQIISGDKFFIFSNFPSPGICICTQYTHIHIHTCVCTYMFEIIITSITIIKNYYNVTLCNLQK